MIDRERLGMGFLRLNDVVEYHYLKRWKQITVSMRV